MAKLSFANVASEFVLKASIHSSPNPASVACWTKVASESRKEEAAIGHTANPF